MISSNAHYIEGRKRFEAKDFEGALEFYTRCIAEEENPSVYSERAVVYFYLKQLDKSMADMNHAASLEPDNPYRYSSRAYIKDAMGDLDGAIEDYERAVTLDPEDSIAYNNLGLLQEKKGYKQKAEASFKKADELAEVDQLLQRIRKEQEEEAAVKESNAEVQENPRQDLSKHSWLALIRETFTTRSGFNEYIRFIKNGFKPS